MNKTWVIMVFSLVLLNAGMVVSSSHTDALLIALAWLVGGLTATKIYPIVFETLIHEECERIERECQERP